MTSFRWWICALLFFAVTPARADQVRIQPAYPIPASVARVLSVAAGEIGYREGEHGKDDEQSHHDADDAVFQPALLLEEEHEGMNHVGQNPSNEEGQQDAGKAVDKPHKCRRDECRDKPPHYAVEGYLTFKHLFIYDLTIYYLRFIYYLVI